MKLSKREKILLILVLIIGGAVAYYLLYFQPCFDEIDRLNAQITSNQTTISMNAKLKIRIEDVTQGLSDDEEQIKEFGDNVNSAFDEPAVLVYLSEVMNDGKGIKTMINFSESGNLGQIKYSKVSVSMNGTYDVLKNVLKEFAEGEYFIKVTSLTVEKTKLTQETSPDDTETTEPPTTDVMLNIGMELDIFNIGDTIPPDKTYDFTGGAVQYGGDLFK